MRRPAGTRHLDVPPRGLATRSGRHPRAVTAASSRWWTAFRSFTCCLRPRRPETTSRPDGPDLAPSRHVGLDDPQQAEAFEAVAASAASTYREVVDALGPNFEGALLPVSLSDRPTSWRRRWCGPWPAPCCTGTRRAVDVCGGSGHLTRVLMDLSSPPAVLADLFFPQGMARAPLHRAGLRTGLLRRQRAPALRARRVRLRDVLRRVSVHLDQTAVHRRVDPSGRRNGRTGRRGDQPHAQTSSRRAHRTDSPLARRLSRPVPKRWSRGYSARRVSSPTS